MLSSTAPIETLRLVEGEMQTLRENVERELVNNLREQIVKVVREALFLEFEDMGTLHQGHPAGNDGSKRQPPAQPLVMQQEDSVEIEHVSPLTHAWKDGLLKAPSTHEQLNWESVAEPHAQVWQEGPSINTQTTSCHSIADIRLPGSAETQEVMKTEYAPTRKHAGKVYGFKASVHEEGAKLTKRTDTSYATTQSYESEQAMGFSSSQPQSNWIKKTQRCSRRSSDGHLNALQQFALQRQQTKSGCVAQIVTSDAFDYFMCCILAINGIVMGVEVDLSARNTDEENNLVFLWLARFFCVAFLSELSLRLYVYELSFYLMPGWQWGYFDTVVVSMQVVEEIWILVEGKAGIDVGFFKLLKMGRLLRMIRMVRLIPELKSMVYLILASMSSFFWSCVLLSLLVYVLAVYMTMMAVDVLTDPGGGHNPEDMQKVRDYWGSVGNSVMSVWWSISGGQDWADLVNPIIDETGMQVHNVVYSMFIAFATMVIMNLVTGVFVEGAQRLKQKDRDKELQRMAKKTFKQVNEANHSSLSKDVFEGHLFNGDLDEYLQAVDLTQETACDLFDMLDDDKDGTINFHEFVDGCIHLARLPRVADIAQVLLDVRKEKEMLQELGRRIANMMSDITQYKKKTMAMMNHSSSWTLRSTAMTQGSFHEV